LRRLGRGSSQFRLAEHEIRNGHYLRSMPDSRTSFEVFAIQLNTKKPPFPTVGYLVFGRPQATRCGEWYGSVEDVLAGRCEVTRWQVLNLARVWIHPRWQEGGDQCQTGIVPGFIDRKGKFRSTLISTALDYALYGPDGHVGYVYLWHRPPVFPNEPFHIRWVLSYCDSRQHRGTIYKAAGFELYRTNADGMQTWRYPLSVMSPEEEADILKRSEEDHRAQKYRAQRAQLVLPGLDG